MEINVIKAKNYELSNLSGLEDQIDDCVVRTMQVLRDKRKTVGFAESCTGGLLSSSLTKVPGVSDVFMGSIVSYANYVKADILGIEFGVLEVHGAVSAECARQMSEKALFILKTDYAVAITGIAGPQGGTTNKPVGTVFISVSGINDAGTISTLIFHHDFSSKNKRTEIQALSVLASLENLNQFILEQGE